MANHADYLDLAKRRLGWALERIKLFHFERDAYLYGRPFQVVRHSQERWNCECHIWHLLIRTDAPYSVRFAAADAVHCLRVVADNVVWGCGQIHGAPGKLALKYVNSPSDIDPSGSYGKQIRKLPAELRDWIQDEQRYDGKHALPDPPSPLSIISKINNRDKHRVVVLLASRVKRAGIAIAGEPEPIRLRYQRKTNLRDGDTILRVVRRIHEEPMKFEPDLSFDVAFDHSTVRYPDMNLAAGHVLMRAYQYIRDEMIPKFEPFMT